MKIKSLLAIALCLATSLLSAQSFSGGSGTAQDPYQITTRADLEAISMGILSGNDFKDSHFLLKNDIDMGTTNFTPIGWWKSSIGGEGFNGSFDGSGKIIRNLFIVNTAPDGLIGLFGYINQFGTVKNLGVEDADISGARQVGILAGNNKGLVTSCYTTGVVKGTGNEIYGGLIGWNQGTIKNCYSHADVSTTTGDFIGGLVGSNNYSGTVTNCYSTGKVSAHAGATRTGGFIGYNGNTIVNCHFNQTNNPAFSGITGVTAQSSSQMRNPSFVDLLNGAAGLSTPFKTFPLNYPSLSFQTGAKGDLFSGGSGTAADPFQLKTRADLDQLSQIVKNGLDCEGATFKLMNDIDMGPSNFTPIGWWQSGGSECPFKGTFDGVGKVIRNLRINESGANGLVGLFGYVSSPGTVMRLGVAGAEVKGVRHVGILVGNNKGLVMMCYTTGSVTATGYDGLGGLIGWNNGTVAFCYSHASVSTSSHGIEVGGLLGATLGLVGGCYSTGTIDAPNANHVGNFTGKNAGTITNCYYEKSADDYADNGSIGVTRAEMVADAFIDRINPVPGATSPFKAGPRNAYPRLTWEHSWLGTGSPDNPYQLSTPANLRELSQIVYDGCHFSGNAFKLMNDIDFGQNPDTFMPIGGYTSMTAEGDIETLTAFNGTFDGNNHVIRNLYINEYTPILDSTTYTVQYYVGFFGLLSNDATIKNLGIEHAKISASIFTIGGTGGLAGFAGPQTSIMNCYVSNSTIGDTVIAAGSLYTGGFIGESKGNITRCYVKETTVRGMISGGFVATANAGNITQCYAKETIVQSMICGGFVAMANNGNITQCYVTGKIYPPDDKCMAGGFAAMQQGGHITHCYAIVDAIEDECMLFGFSGMQGGQISNCYAVGNGFAFSLALSGKSNNSYYNKETVTMNLFGEEYEGLIETILGEIFGGTGLTTDEMQDRSFVNMLNQGSTIWRFMPTLAVNGGYPILAWQDVDINIFANGTTINVTSNDFKLTDDFYTPKTAFNATYTDPFSSKTKKISVKAKKSRANPGSATLTLRGKVSLLNRKLLSGLQKLLGHFTADLLAAYPEIQQSPVAVTVIAKNKNGTGTECVTLFAMAPLILDVQQIKSNNRYYLIATVAYADSTKSIANLEYKKSTGQLAQPKLKIHTHKNLEKLLSNDPALDSAFQTAQLMCYDDEEPFVIEIPSKFIDDIKDSPEFYLIIDNKSGIGTYQLSNVQ